MIDDSLELNEESSHKIVSRYSIDVNKLSSLTTIIEVKDEHILF